MKSGSPEIVVSLASASGTGQDHRFILATMSLEYNNSADFKNWSVIFGIGLIRTFLLAWLFLRDSKSEHTIAVEIVMFFFSPPPSEDNLTYLAKACL